MNTPMYYTLPLPSFGRVPRAPYDARTLMNDGISPYDYREKFREIEADAARNAKLHPDQADAINAAKQRRIAELRNRYRSGPWLVKHPWIAWAAAIAVLGVTFTGVTSIRLAGWLLWTLPFAVLAVLVDFNVAGNHSQAKRAVAFAACALGVVSVVHMHQSHVAACHRGYASYVAANPPGWVTGADGRQDYFTPMSGPQWAGAAPGGCGDVYRV